MSFTPRQLTRHASILPSSETASSYPRRYGRRQKTPYVLALTILFLLTIGTRADAQEDKVSFLFSPQLWLSNIPDPGFSPPGVLDRVIFGGGHFLTRGQLQATSTFFPERGGQLAAQYRGWTPALSGQYVTYTVEDSLLTKNTQAAFNFPDGVKVNTEKIDTARIDIDSALTYFFPDVIRNVLDLSTGVGFKWIRANGDRTLEGINGFFPQQYMKVDGTASNAANFTQNFYGATLPTTFSFRLTDQGQLLLPITASPFLGYEHNSDEVNGAQSKFAYGGTFDVGLRYVFESGAAVYIGYRAQVIQGTALYFAQGPFFNFSYRFGGK